MHFPFLRLCYIFICKRLCVLLVLSVHLSLAAKFLFPVSLSLISPCGRPDKLSIAVGGLGAFYWVSISSNMWLMGGCIFHSLVLISGARGPKQLNMLVDN